MLKFGNGGLRVGAVCVSLCVCAHAQWPGQSDLQFKTVKATDLNANTSKMVKATDFKFDVHVSRESLDTTP